LSRIGPHRRYRAGKPWRSGAKAGAVVPFRRRGPSPGGRALAQLAVRGARAHPRRGPPAPSLQPHFLLRPPGPRLHAAEGSPQAPVPDEVGAVRQPIHAPAPGGRAPDQGGARDRLAGDAGARPAAAKGRGGRGDLPGGHQHPEPRLHADAGQDRHRPARPGQRGSGPADRGVGLAARVATRRGPQPEVRTADLAEGRGSDGLLRVRGPAGRPPDAPDGHRHDHGRADADGERPSEPVPEAVGTVAEREWVAVFGEGSWGSAFGTIYVGWGIEYVLW